MDRLQRLMKNAYATPEALTGALYRAISEHQDMARLNDDVTFLAVRLLDAIERAEHGSAGLESE